MESIDNEKAQRVWERVRGGGGAVMDTGALAALLSQELSDAAVFTQLARRLGGRGGTLLHLSRQCRQNAGCLRGICVILDGKPPVVAVPAPAEEQTVNALRRCYVNSLGRIHEYESRSRDPDYGLVFRKMSAAMEDQCTALLDLIGKLER